MSQVFLSYPVLGRPELNSLFTVYQAILSSRKHQVRLYANLNDSLISRVRNVHISEFLHTYKDCDYFFSIDSDLEIVNAYPNNNIFNKLIEHDLDFVGGLYALKKPDVQRSASITMDGSTPQFDTGLKEMRWLSSGCWCIKRSAIEKMVKAYPELDYIGDDYAAGKQIHGLYIPYIYEFKPEELDTKDQDVRRKYLSEDWSFCNRWRDIGGKIYADTSIVLNHIGSYNYSLWDVKVEQVKVPNTPLVPPPVGYDLPKKQI